jgi:hypothetical protein
MMAALSGEPSEALPAPALNPEFEHKFAAEFETWGESETEDPDADYERDLNIAPRRGLDGELLAFVTEWLGYARLGIAHLRRRRWQYCCRLQSTLWNPPAWAKDQYQREIKWRNNLRCRATPTEWGNKDAFYGVWRASLLLSRRSLLYFSHDCSTRYRARRLIPALGKIRQLLPCAFR